MLKEHLFNKMREKVIWKLHFHILEKVGTDIKIPLIIGGQEMLHKRK